MKTLLLSVLLITFSTAFSQSNRFGFGFSLSGVASQVIGDGASGFNRPGFGAGVFSRITLPSENRFKFGVSYIQKGSRVWPNLEKGIQQYILNAHYVEVPLIWEISISNLVFETGLTASRNIGVEEIDHFGNTNTFVERDPHFAELGFLIGYHHELSDKLHLNLRYGNSITPFRPHAGGQTFLINFGQYHSYVQVDLNYLLR